MSAIESATRELARLPGIGPKTAQRLVYHLLKNSKEQMHQLAESIEGLRERVRPCERCGNFSEDALCDVCANTNRQTSCICVVEEAFEVAAIERTGQFHGVYHVLGGRLSPLDGVGPESLALDTLAERVAADDVSEVILATNASMEGEATAVYLETMLRPVGVRITRLARGIPMGSDLEYVDGTTLAQALAGRREMQ